MIPRLSGAVWCCQLVLHHLDLGTDPSRLLCWSNLPGLWRADLHSHRSSIFDALATHSVFRQAIATNVGPKLVDAQHRSFRSREFWSDLTLANSNST